MREAIKCHQWQSEEKPVEAFHLMREAISGNQCHQWQSEEKPVEAFHLMREAISGNQCHQWQSEEKPVEPFHLMREAIKCHQWQSLSLSTALAPDEVATCALPYTPAISMQSACTQHALST